MPHVGAPKALSKALEDQVAYIRELEGENARLAKLLPLNDLLAADNKKLREENEVLKLEKEVLTHELKAREEQVIKNCVGSLLPSVCVWNA